MNKSQKKIKIVLWKNTDFAKSFIYKQVLKAHMVI